MAEGEGRDRILPRLTCRGNDGFGAIGNNCGGVEAGELEYGDYCVRHDPISEPDLATCFINGGSWEYDECCVANRVGGNAPESEARLLLARNRKAPQPAAYLPVGARDGRRTALDGPDVGQGDRSNFKRLRLERFPSKSTAPRPAPLFTGTTWKRYCCSRSGDQIVKHLGDSLNGLRWSCF